MFCYHCKSPLEPGTYEAGGVDRTVPRCPVHGFLWRLTTNQPAADCVVVKNGLVLLIERAHEPRKGNWSTPGGYVEAGEHPRDAAKRECFEETGMTVELDSLIGVYVDDIPNGFNQITAYAATTQDEPALSSEITNYGWFALDNLPDPVSPWCLEMLSDLREHRFSRFLPI
jgi:ADP-ribose pyrophosphatase YjhB (NUDIX family)